MSKVQHLLLGLLTLMLAAATVGIGYLVFHSSYSVTYDEVNSVYVRDYISGDDDNHHVSYLALDDGRLFYVHELDFTPAFSASALGPSGLVAFVYRSDSAMSIDVSSTSGSHLSGTAYRIIALTALGASGQLFTTQVYTDHPNGFFNDRSDVAYLIYSVAGLIALAGLIFRGRGPIVAAGIAGGALVLPLAWLILLDTVSGVDWESGSSAASVQILIAKVAIAVGAVVGAVVGVVVVMGMRDDDQAESRRRQRRAARTAQRKQRSAQAATALQAAPTTWADWSNRGNNLDTLKRHEEAVQAYDRALAASPPGNPMEWAIWNNKAEALKNARRFAESLEANDRAIAMQPNQPAVLVTRGFVLLQLGRYAEAVQVYEQLARLAPSDVTVLNNYSAALAETGRIDEAIRICESVLKIDPDNATARGNLSTLRSRPTSITLRESDEDV